MILVRFRTKDQVTRVRIFSEIHHKLIALALAFASGHCPLNNIQ